MYRNLITLALATLWLVPASIAPAQDQFPEPSPEHKLLMRDVGQWKCAIKMWMGEDGQTDPSAEPQMSEGTESNRKMGEFWVLSTFKGEFAGMPFEGHAVSGFDPIKKKFVGSWCDSFTPTAMHMEGTYDKATDTMTFNNKGIGMDGKEMLSKTTVKYDGRQSRLMTMYEIKDGKELKSMEIQYTRVKRQGKGKQGKKKDPVPAAEPVPAS